MQKQDIQLIKRIINFIKVDLRQLLKTRGNLSFSTDCHGIVVFLMRKKRFYCVAAQYLFALLKCLGTQNWDQNLSLLTAVPIFHLQSKYGNMPAGKPHVALLSAETWLVELHEREAYLGLADGALLLYSQGIAHSVAGICLWAVCFTGGALGYGGWEDLHSQGGYPACSFLGEE